jgi:hypothetical protein
VFAKSGKVSFAIRLDAIPRTKTCVPFSLR